MFSTGHYEGGSYGLGQGDTALRNRGDQNSGLMAPKVSYPNLGHNSLKRPYFLSSRFSPSWPIKRDFSKKQAMPRMAYSLAVVTRVSEPIGKFMTVCGRCSGC